MIVRHRDGSRFTCSRRPSVFQRDRSDAAEPGPSSADSPLPACHSAAANSAASSLASNQRRLRPYRICACPAKIVQPARIDIAVPKISCREDPAEEPNVRLDSGCVIFVERALQSRDRLSAIASPRDQFSKHRIVFVRHRPACIDAVIQTNSGARSGTRSSRIFPGEGKKLLSGSSA